jgi:hypothetical protein
MIVNRAVEQELLNKKKIMLPVSGSTLHNQEQRIRVVTAKKSNKKKHREAKTTLESITEESDGSDESDYCTNSEVDKENNSHSTFTNVKFAVQ